MYLDLYISLSIDLPTYLPIQATCLPLFVLIPSLHYDITGFHSFILCCTFVPGHRKWWISHCELSVCRFASLYA